MNYRWVTNIHESEWNPWQIRGVDPEKDWMVGKFVGEPKGTDVNDTEALRLQGYIGLYEYTEEVSCEH